MTLSPGPARTRRPLVARTRDELAEAVVTSRSVGGRTGLVPTMGALHRGHAALLDQARDRLGDGGALVVSVFVNPLQFGAGEDLDRYPRTFDADLEVCARHGADVVFAPTVEEVYPDGEPLVSVDPGPLGTVLEGATRPGHFRGVLTVVAKLFGIVRPDLALFGRKDYQQLVLVRRMVRDLCQGVEVVGGETVRDDDGLALSSRNAYLSEAERRTALVLVRALRAGAAAGPHGADDVLAAAGRLLDDEPAVELDYQALRSPDLGPTPPAGDARLLVAARVGRTRLIDNTDVLLGAPT